MVPASIETNSTLDGDAARPDDGARSSSRATASPPTTSTSILPLPLIARAWARATAAWPGRARCSTSSWTSSTRPGRASTSSPSRRTGWSRSSRAADVRPGHDQGRQALARHAGGEAGRRRRRDPGPAGAARAARSTRPPSPTPPTPTSTSPAGRCSAAASAARCVFGRLGGGARLPAAPQRRVSVAEANAPRLPAGAGQRLHAAVHRPQRLQPSTTSGQPAPAVNAGTLQRHLALLVARRCSTGSDRDQMRKEAPMQRPRRLMRRLVDAGRAGAGAARGAARAAPRAGRRRRCRRSRAATWRRGPYAAMHMLLQKTVLNINVADHRRPVRQGDAGPVRRSSRPASLLARPGPPAGAGGDRRQARGRA